MTALVLGIDPGNTQSAYAFVRPDYSIDSAAKTTTEGLVAMLRSTSPAVVAIECLRYYGMTVGREVFETAYVIGRILQVCIDRGFYAALYPKPQWAPAITGVRKNTDAVVRQALLLRFGGDRKGEPLYLLKGCSDKRSAYGVAVYHIDVTRAPGRPAA